MSIPKLTQYKQKKNLFWMKFIKTKWISFHLLTKNRRIWLPKILKCFYDPAHLEYLKIIPHKKENKQTHTLCNPVVKGLIITMKISAKGYFHLRKKNLHIYWERNYQNEMNSGLFHWPPKFLEIKPSDILP